MSTTRLILSFAALAALTGPIAAVAQQSQAPAQGTAPAPADPASSHSTAQSEAGEPRATAQSEAGEPRATAQSEAGEPRATSPRGSEQPRASAQSEAGEPRAKTSAEAPKAASRPSRDQPAAAKEGKAANDRLELGTATVTGDREQPKVMYIVPWKKSDIGDLSGKPMNSLLDEALAPVDRDEFKRQVVYYQAVKADASQNGAKSPPQQGEK
jgi:hypothetical protein